MEAHGLLQPIVVTPTDSAYTIIAGDRRYLAARLLGWETIEAKVIQRPPPDTETLTLVENIHREDLTPLEEARVVHQLVITRGMDVDLVARRFGKGRGWVDNRLEMYAWHENILDAIHEGKITIAVGRQLNNVTDEGYRAYLIRMAHDNGATSRTARIWFEDWERTLRETGQHPTAETRPVQPYSGQAVGVACGACEKMLPVSQLTTIYVCWGCLQPQPATDPHTGEPQTKGGL